MGIQDRDYYREGPSFLDRVGAQGATVWLVAITTGVFIVEMFTGLEKGSLFQIGVYDPRLVLQGQVWRLVTAVFLHRDLLHLVFNMFLLYWAGQRLEELYGGRELVSFYLFAGVGAHLVFLLAYLAGLSPPVRAIGASGAVIAVLVVFAFHFPRVRLLLFLVIPVPAWGLVLAYVVLDLLGALQLRGGEVAYIVHLGGAFFGLLYYESGWQFTKMYVRRPAPRVRPKLVVVPPPSEAREPEPVPASVPAAPRPAEAADEQLEAKLDSVLEKVSKYGQGSLTAEEREILFRASELFKKRRK